MEFEEHKNISYNQKKYHSQNIHLAREFIKELVQEMRGVVKSCVLFGSNTHETLNKDSDIDIMIVLDNVSVYVTPELRESYQIIVQKIVSQVSPKLHIMSMNLSDVWDMARKGDPLFINILRHGVPLYDTSLIEPMQYLLEIGKIRPTTESIMNFKARSEQLMNDYHTHLENCYYDLYYALVDGVHAMLMSVEVTPPSPKEMPHIIPNYFTSKKGQELSHTFLEIYNRMKEIEYRRGGRVTTQELEKTKKSVEKQLQFCYKEIDKKI
ncbi:MAG: nucleotidyltransferase domain-containing protein [Candidatus Nanoarchaeia archaeon]